MKTFLEYVAEDIISKYGTDLSRVAVVFPNKRASLFLNEHLARLAGCPIWSPAYFTISDLFRRHSRLQVGDPVKLICELHKSFVRQTGFDETLDHFYGWGQVLLADFDDLDKNMAPAKLVFANLGNLHELDDVSYLTDEQKAIIHKFFSNFSEEHNSQLKERFLRLWSRMNDIYEDFNRSLAGQGLAYEGALYRLVAQDEELAFHYDTYLFIGFNMLQKVEQTLFSKLRREGKAHFYWDFDRYYMAHHEAGHYIAQYLEDFPNELDVQAPDIYDNFRQLKQLTYISASTENLQGRYVAQWLNEQNRNRIGDGRHTAIVLCDERLLPTVIHALPDEADKVNITTGYPLAQTPVAGLVSQLISMQTLGYAVQAGRYRRKFVAAVQRHPYAHYIPDDVLMGMSHDGDFNSALMDWLCRLLQLLAINARAEATPESSDPLFQEAVFRTYTLMNRLQTLIVSGDLKVDAMTLSRLVQQLVSTTTIPFHGEPIEGIQVMGVLETRNLDFSHVLVLSCNEGNMPRGVSDTSFIPYSIRKAYGLTTIDNKVAIYAYYFHRLLQRAGDVTLTYNSAASTGRTGEMSRFMLQIMVESGLPIEFKSMQTGMSNTAQTPQPISKTAHVMQLLYKRFDKRQQPQDGTSSPLLTPTAINRYLRCQLQFFYNYVSGLHEPDEEEDGIIDNCVFGNIFHEAAQTLYERLAAQGQRVTRSDFDQMLKHRADIERAVDDAIHKELNLGRDLNGIQIINREVIIHYLHTLLQIDRQLAPFTIIGLEKDVIEDLQMGELTTTIGGRIDRLDMVDTGADAATGGRIRVVDYKTGSRQLRPLADVDAIFDTANVQNHSDYYLQTFVYANIVRRGTSLPVSPALLFIQHAGADDYDPTLSFGKERIVDVAATQAAFAQHLHEVVAQMFDPALPFTPTDNRDICRICPYKSLCFSAR